jgi:hypothetical protein
MRESEQNMKNAAIFLLIVAVGALGWKLWADKSLQDNYEFTEKCASQAAKVFARLEGGQTGSTFAHYQSHFNPRLNKCFMLLEGTDYSTGVHYYSDLYDAYEQRQYADFTSWVGNPAGNLMACDLTPLSGDERKCASRAEYDAFVAEYMK